MADKTTRRIQVFKAGTFTDMSGAVVSFSAADLSGVASVYDPAKAPAPAVVGHPKADSPAYGWAKSFAVGDDGVLTADVGDLAPAFVEAVKSGAYKKVSMSFFSPDASNNPFPGSWYPKHIGFLGGAAPAVPGLAPVAFASDEQGIVTVEMADTAFRDVAQLFRSIRDHLIEKEGLDVANTVLPEWTIGWIDDQGRDDDDRGPSFSSPKIPETTMTEIARREADLAAREQQLAAREKEARQADNLAFAEKVISEGRVLPASRDKLLGLLNGLPVDGSVSFAEGAETKSAAAAVLVRDILSAQPPVVPFGQVAKAEPGAATVEFAAPDGMQVDKEGLATLAKAEAYRKLHPTVSFVEAVKAVS